MESKIALRPDRLRQLREQHGWSQRELARRCGFGEAQVRHYEKGETDPSSTYLNLMAEQLNVSNDYLLGVTDDPRRPGDSQGLSDDEIIMLDLFRREGWPGVIHLGVDRITK